MITYFILFVLSCSEVLKRHISESALLFFQIITSFAATLFLFIDNESLNIFSLYSRDGNESLVIGILMIFGFIKLYEVIALNKKEARELTLSLVILLAIAHSNIYLKLLSVALFFIRDIIENESTMEIKKINIFLLAVAMVISPHSNNNVYLVNSIYLVLVGVIIWVPLNPLSLIVMSMLHLKLSLSSGLSYVGCFVVWINIILFVVFNNHIPLMKNGFLKRYLAKIDFYKARNAKSKLSIRKWARND